MKFNHNFAVKNRGVIMAWCNCDEQAFMNGCVCSLEIISDPETGVECPECGCGSCYICYDLDLDMCKNCVITGYRRPWDDDDEEVVVVDEPMEVVIDIDDLDEPMEPDDNDELRERQN